MKNSLLSFFRRHPLYVLASLLLLIAVVWLLLIALPFGRSGMMRTACVVEGESRLYFHSDTSYILLERVPVAQQGVWVNRWWAVPSCRGRILTVAPSFPFLKGNRKAMSGKDVSVLMKQHLDSLQSVLKRKKVEQQELAYYLRTHGVQDEGYGVIAQYSSRQQQIVDSLQRLCVALDRALSGKRLSLTVRADYKARWVGNKGQWQQTPLQTFNGGPSLAGKAIVLRTYNHRTPLYIRPASKFPWTTARDKKVLTVCLMPADSAGQYRPVIVESSFKNGHHNLPQVFRRQGCAVFTSRGYFFGVIDQKSVRK